MAAKRDYYEVLGLERDAGSAEIKSAYRKLAVRHHPDRNPGDRGSEERFKEAAEAYAVLSDAQKRARYDRFGHQGVSGGGGTSGFDPDIFGDFSDILGDFFGFGFGDMFGGQRSRTERPGADLRYELEMSLEEAAAGIERSLRIPRLESCATCSGSGSASGTSSACSACAGRGQVRMTQGFFTVARTCPQCRGEGRTVTDPCRDCRGEGRIERERSLEVKVPPGVDTGTRLRLVGEGEDGRRGGRTGDLYVDIIVLPHDRLVRHGADVMSELVLSYPQAVLGTTVTVETLHGETDLEIPPGTGDGKDFRLAGEGIPHLGARGRGDHLARVRLDVPHPRHLSDEYLETLRGLAELEGSRIQEGRGVLDRVKDLFG